MTITKFDGHENAQAYFIEDYDHGFQALQSYNTRVIESRYDVIRNALRHTIYGLYSMTTRKHIGWYAKAQGLAYSHFKWAYEHDCDILQDYTSGMIDFIHRETGEILDTIKYH